ncbi:hypothetical protein CTZ24_03900 [Pantoea phytobeneficialis]|uniref:Uncharacterized protein n=1 Tax=Pantoea phytobeneficialis TaxID=2052056 RepID=A0AAP9KNA4_9GAMM|nr:hypothetical protein CTZ24_03900 [Pantoea phytobeneficialis]
MTLSVCTQRKGTDNFPLLQDQNKTPQDSAFTKNTSLDGVYTRHTSNCRCVGCARSPQSITDVSSWGFTPLPPTCNPNYFGYIR